ncbi:MAG TPA: YIP1 family protein [Methylomirabilota bacterium]
MTFVERMIGAAKLDPRVYEEVEADRSATPQALGVVVLASVAGGIGVGAGLRGLVVGTLGGLVGWAVWAWLIYFIGTRWLPEPDTRADFGELLRTLGFATSPGILRVVGPVPVLGPIVFIVTLVWMLVAVIIAVRQALDYRSTVRAVGVCLIGWLVQVVILALVFGIFARPVS